MEKESGFIRVHYMSLKTILSLEAKNGVCIYLLVLKLSEQGKTSSFLPSFDFRPKMNGRYTRNYGKHVVIKHAHALLSLRYGDIHA